MKKCEYAPRPTSRKYQIRKEVAGRDKCTNLKFSKKYFNCGNFDNTFYKISETIKLVIFPLN
jgi:hypothetical protein